MASSDTLVFPEQFVWGAATSSYQIEGAAHLDDKGPSIWDTFCREQGRIKDGSNGDRACDHIRLMDSDVALMGKLGLQAYRFSISWPRVMPRGFGKVNAKGLDVYDRLVDTLLASGITPYPTLYHWDLPQALEDDGGWQTRTTAEAFGDYAEAVLDRLGDRVSTWTTLNEPYVSANHGYVTGEHAPGITSQAAGFAASHHLMLAHGMAGERVRSIAPDARLAIVLNFTALEPASDSTADAAATEIAQEVQNRWYIDPLMGRDYPELTTEHYGWDRREVHDGDLDVISAPIDLLGVNYYTRQIVSVDGEVPHTPTTPQNTMGWELYPKGLAWLLRWLHDEYSPPSMMITENGCPMPDTVRDERQVIDDDRIVFIRDHLTEVHAAIADGVPVEGYLVWSLFDNFEWAWGYGPTFGIVEVDFDTLERHPKKSADWYREAIAANGFALPEVPVTYRD